MAGLKSKIKSGVISVTSDRNTIYDYFDVGEENCLVGPGLIWRVHNAINKRDGRKCSVYLLDKRTVDKIYKPKKKETMLQRVRYGVVAMKEFGEPFLQLIHPLVETSTTMAFATEEIVGSLENILAWNDWNVRPGGNVPLTPHPVCIGSPGSQAVNLMSIHVPPPPHAKQHHFLDIEVRCGFLNLIEALSIMHYTHHLVHRNLCPEVIIITQKGSWKLFGIEFSEPIDADSLVCLSPVTPWVPKVPKSMQPNLDYLAPESQEYGEASNLSDMFSLGLVMCAYFNNGKSMIIADNNPLLYTKQVEFLIQQVRMIMDRIPAALQEVILRLLSSDPLVRPSAQLLPLIKYFKGPNEPIIAVFQFFDGMRKLEGAEKEAFYHGTLVDTLPFLPKKLRWVHVWPKIYANLKILSEIPYVMPAVAWIAKEATKQEYSTYIAPSLQAMLFSRVHYKGYVTLLENLHVFLRKCPEDAIFEFIDILFLALDKGPALNQVDLDVGTLTAVYNLPEFLEDRFLHGLVLRKVKVLLEKNASNLKAISLVVGFFEKVLVRLERTHVLTQVIPTLLAMRLKDPALINRIVELYKLILAEGEYGLTMQVMAEKIVPSLAPQTANPALNAGQFANLMEILYEMMENIEQTKQEISKQKEKKDDQAVVNPGAVSVTSPSNIPVTGPSTVSVAGPSSVPVTGTSTLPIAGPSAGRRCGPSAGPSSAALAGTAAAPSPGLRCGPNAVPIAGPSAFPVPGPNTVPVPGPKTIPVPFPNVTAGPERRALLQRRSIDTIPKDPIPFSIPNLRVERRKTSSAEDMARKTSITGPPPTGSVGGLKSTGIGSWFFNNTVGNSDNNFLRVISSFPTRRSSDNTLMTPKIRIAPSCASSPGGSPGGASGLPTRRHSSIGSQERRTSNVNLSPPTSYQYRGRKGGSGSSLSVPSTSQSVGGSMPNTSSSVPFLLTSSMQSVRSRRPSASSQSSSLMHQLSSGLVRHLPGSSNLQPRGSTSNWSTLQSATTAGYNALTKGASSAVRNMSPKK